MPTVSVIAAAHNQQLHIHQAIQSVLNQSFKDIELIVTDDASTDATLEIIRLFSGDARLKVLCNSHSEGFAAALSRSGSVSTGKYVAWLDCNDIYEKHHLETLVAHLDGNESSIGAFGLASLIDVNGENVDMWTEAAIDSNRYHLLNLLYRGTQPLCRSAGLVRRENVVDAGHMLPEFGFSYDAALWTNLLFQGDLDVVPELVVRSRKREEPLTGAERNRRSFENFELLNLFVEQIKSTELLLNIFPEVGDVNLPVTDNLIQFHLALIALSSEFPSNRLFGLHSVHQIMRDPESAALLRSDCGFSYQDLFDFEDDLSVFSDGAVEIEVKDLKEQVENSLTAPLLGKRLRPIGGHKVNYTNVLPGWFPLAGISLREGPHPEHGIPFAFNWVSGPEAILTVTSDRTGPHMLVMECQSLLLPRVTIEVSLDENSPIQFIMNHKTGHKTDVFQAIVNLGPGVHPVIIRSDKWQEPSDADSRNLAFLLKDIRLWECF